MSPRTTRFSIGKFTIQATVQFGFFLLAFRTLLPGVWAQQIRAGPLAFLLTFLVLHLVNAFVEWFFHRYFLHAVLLPIFRWLAQGHRHHHALTDIKLRRTGVGEDRIVICEYPIVKVEQFEDSAFPPYALVAFWTVFTPFFLLVQWLFPYVPVYLAGYPAIAWSLWSYEVIHAVEHWPYEWWKGAIEHPRFGGMLRRMYSFHHFHHAMMKVNEAISGFFGLPVADFVLGTLHIPPDLLLDGRKATVKELVVRKPCWPVRILDNWARDLEEAFKPRKRKSAPAP